MSRCGDGVVIWCEGGVVIFDQRKIQPLKLLPGTGVHIHTCKSIIHMMRVEMRRVVANPIAMHSGDR